MRPILFGAAAGLFACGALLRHSLAQPAERHSLAAQPPTFPCQTCGTVFSFDPATRSELVVHSFEDDGVDGYDPNAGLIEYRGDLYGTTEAGGAAGKSCGDFCGTVYTIDLKTGRERVLYTFLGGTDALNPGAGLHAVGHLFYGTTYNGGTGSAGTVFSFDPRTRMEAVVYSFQQNGQDGIGPSSSLIDVGGMLYGVTGGGGTYGGGTVFSVNPASGAETVLHSFGNGQDGDSPYTNLTAEGQVLYGTTYSGGVRDAGTVFSLNPTTGVEAVVHSFTDGDDGAGPYGGLVRASGRLYGTTVDDDTCSDGDTGQGSVYAIDIANGAEIDLHCFSDYTQGGGLEPFGSLFRDKLFYGTTQVGGSGTSCGGGNCGTIFSMTKYGHTKTLYSFCSQAGCPDGAFPDGDLIDVGGVFYGTTVDGGSGASAPAGAAERECATMMRVAPGTLALLLASSAAGHASIVIGSGSTQNISCSGGVCTPTKRDAVLNVNDLENMLASQAVEIMTTGSRAQALTIVIAAPLGWSGINGLALEAYQSITIEAPVSVAGAAAFTLSAYDGSLSFEKKGTVTFQNLSSALTINGTSFTLVDSIATLASAIASDPAGTYALAGPYDASGDGTYTHAPVRPVLSGVFEGLGNTISNLTVDDPGTKRNVGLFAEVSGVVRDIGLVSANVSAGKSGNVGALIGSLDTGGTVLGSFASGSVSAKGGDGGTLGGLIGFSMGDVSIAHARVRVSDVNKADTENLAGGLIGYNLGSVEQSFSEGSVEIASSGWFGGFVGDTAEGTISNCYATGKVSDTAGEGGLGGFVGAAQGNISDSYATGLVSGGYPSETGGFEGSNADEFVNDYWDTTTSGQENGTGGGNVSGLTGLTSAELQSGLPDGFPPDIWAQKTKLNKGFPYLLDNRP